MLAEQLMEYQRNCGRNCVRKYDKTYKLFNTQEQQLLRSFCEDEEITPEDFMKAAERDFMDIAEKD